MSDRTKRTADIVVDILDRAGVRAVFGLPGGTIAPIFDALMDHRDIHTVITKHECAAMFAAAGYAFASGNLGVVATTSGPGVLNALTGLAAAHSDGLPLLLIAGEVSRNNRGRGALQEGSAFSLNIVQMAKHICKLALEIPDASAAPALFRRAITTAMSGRKGPVLVTLPIDVARSTIHVPEIGQRMVTRYEVEELHADSAAKALSRSERKVIFAGNGCRTGRGPELLRELAETLQCPVMTTPKGKGVFPEDHPLSLGIHGIGGHASAHEHMKGGVETILAIGTSLGDLATNGWSKTLIPSRTFIHVDIDAAQIGRAYQTTISIACSAETFLEEMLSRVTPAKTPKTYGINYHKDPELTFTTTPGKIAPERAIWELQQVLPRETVYTIDSGEHNLFILHYLKSFAPDSFMLMMGLASMSASIGSAIGVKLAQPERPVTVLCGDGGFAMACSEVATAAQEKLPITFAIFNDQRLGMVELGNIALYGRTPSYTTGPMDMAALGRALGARAAVIDRPGAILELEMLREERDYPIVLDIRIDENSRMPRNARFEALGAKN